MRKDAVQAIFDQIIAGYQLVLLRLGGWMRSKDTLPRTNKSFSWTSF